MKRIGLYVLVILLVLGCSGGGDSKISHIDFWDYLSSDYDIYKETDWIETNTSTIKDSKLGDKKLIYKSDSVVVDQILKSTSEVYLNSEHNLNDTNITTNKLDRDDIRISSHAYARYIAIGDEVYPFDFYEDNYTYKCKYTNHFDIISLHDGYSSFDDVIEITCSYSAIDLNITYGPAKLIFYTPWKQYYSKGYGWIGESYSGVSLNDSVVIEDFNKMWLVK